MLLAAALLTSLLVGAVQAAASAEPSDCHDDQMTDRCDERQQARVRELFGVRAVEEHARSGDQVRRVFYVDGYGRDVVAIEFIRPRGADPAVRVHSPTEEDGTRVPHLQAPVPVAAWNRVLAASSHFDRALPKIEQSPEGGEFTICLHSWVYTAEATDPDASDGSSAIRRRTENACQHGLTQAFATEISEIAVGLFPHCDLLDREQHRNESTLLAACHALKGDRFSAALVMNEANALRSIHNNADAVHLQRLFHYDARIDWAGEKHSGANAAKFWTRRAIQAGRTHLFITEIVGETQNRVKLRGVLNRSVDNGYEQADVEQVWSFKEREVRIREAVVGNFRKLSD